MTTTLNLPPSGPVPFSDEELSANSPLLGPVAKAFATYAGTLKDLPEMADTLGKDRYLSEEGRRAKLTTYGVQPALADLTKGLAKLAEVESHFQGLLKTRVKALEAETTLGPLSDGRRAELLAVAQAFRLLPKGERERRQAASQRRADPDRETLEMMQHISPTVWGGTPVMQDLARRHGAKAVESDAEVQRLVGLMEKAGTARRRLTAAQSALVDAADRDLLQQAGLVGKRLRDMSNAEKSAYIAAHGLEAFKTLSP